MPAVSDPSCPHFIFFAAAGMCQNTPSSLCFRQPQNTPRLPQPLEQLVHFLYKRLLTILLQQFISGYAES